MVSIGQIWFPALLVIFCLVIIVFNKIRTAGKQLCIFLEESEDTTFKLIKPDGDMIVDKDFSYIIKQTTEHRRNIRFPMGWPKIFQELVPASMYFRGIAEPINWAVVIDPKKDAKNPSKKLGIASMELNAITDPRWMRNIVRGASEGAGESRWQKILPLLGVAMSAIALIMLFALFAKMGGLQAVVADMSERLKLIKP